MLPGDKSKNNILASIIRVNHAGEFGAKRIYQGQLDKIKDSEAKKLIEHMKIQEEVHLEYFDNELIKRKIRPTILMPLWSIYSYLLGSLTASLGAGPAMACTQAVEEVINEHYLSQIKILDDSEKELKNTIEKFRQEELEHHDIALEHNSTSGKEYKFLSTLIKTSCKIAIKLSKVI